MATETIVSPGVLLQEIDRSFITPGTDPSGLAIIGPTVRGPIEVPTLVQNYNDYKNIFGTTLASASNAYEYFTSITAKNYFQNGGSSAIVTRVVKTAADWAHASSSLITAVSSSDNTNDPFTITTLGKGVALNNFGTALEYAGGGLKTGSKDNIRWEVSNINKANGTFTVSVRRGDDTTASPLVLEQFTNCSLDPLSPNYIQSKIGDQYYTNDGVSVSVNGEYPNKSQYIRISAVKSPTYQYLAPDGSVAISDSTSKAYSFSLPNSGSGSFTGGVGDNLLGKPLFGSAITADNIQGLLVGDYTNAINILKNKEEFKFRTLVAPGLNQENTSTTVATIISNTTFRGDSLFIADTGLYGATIADTKTYSEALDTSYAATYWPWVQVRSTELGRNIWCPPSVVIPGVFSKNDSIAAPWFAPAGLTRGGIPNVVKAEKKLSKTQRDDLYTSKVNPIATFPGQGIVVFGQKTLQQATSALDRVNVRRMLLDVKDTIGGFSRKLVFEQNTQQTRDRFVNQATPYLESLVQRQGLYAFQVKMDGQLNTPDIIDANKLVGQVFLQPTKTAEFIVLDFILTPTGASFTD
jgi:uncharacterized protein